MSEITILASNTSFEAYRAAIEGKSADEVLAIGTPLLNSIIANPNATAFDIRMARATLDNIVEIYAPFTQRRQS